MTHLERTRAIEKRRKELEIAAEQEHVGLRAEVAEMFAGKTYVLFLYTYLKDIRLALCHLRRLEILAAKSTTGCGRDIRAIFLSCAPIQRQTVLRQRMQPKMCLTGPNVLFKWLRAASKKMKRCFCWVIPVHSQA